MDKEEAARRGALGGSSPGGLPPATPRARAAASTSRAQAGQKLTGSKSRGMKPGMAIARPGGITARPAGGAGRGRAGGQLATLHTALPAGCAQQNPGSMRPPTSQLKLTLHVRKPGRRRRHQRVKVRAPHATAPGGRRGRPLRRQLLGIGGRRLLAAQQRAPVGCRGRHDDTGALSLDAQPGALASSYSRSINRPAASKLQPTPCSPPQPQRPT